MTAICSKCGTRPRAKSNYWCLECCKEARNRRRDVNREYVLEYLKEHPCVDCGLDDPVCIALDHLGEKTANVSYLILHGSLKALKAELALVASRCHNCHAKVTAARANTYRHRMGVAS